MDLYATHIKVLETIFKNRDIDNIVEFGMGNFSTQLFIDKGEYVTSIEMQQLEWFNIINNKFKDCRNWTGVKLIGPMEFLNYKYPDRIELGFVDGHGSSRPECINFLMNKKCPIIVAHDTEEPGYGWNRVLQNIGYKKFEYQIETPWTTCWTNDDNLFEILNRDLK